MREQLDEERDKVKSLSSELAAAKSKPAASGGGEGLKDDLDLVYQDINSITRDWRNNVETLGDLVGEVQGSGSNGGAGSTFDQIGEILTSMNDASSGMKQALKQMRTLLSGEDG